MTAYTAIPDSDIDPESPGTTTLFTRLRDNPIAITEGSSGAPQIQNAALAGYPFPGTAITGVLTLIEAWTPTATTEKVFTWDETAYSAITMIIDNVRPSTDADLCLQFGYGVVPTIISLGIYQIHARGFGTATIASESGIGHWSLSLNGAGAQTVGSAAGEGFSSELKMVVPSVGRGLVITQSATYKNGVGSVFFTDIEGDATTTTVQANTLRLYWSTGNFSLQGNVSIYGLKRA